MGSGGKILVIRGGAIGDFVLTLPALSALRAQFPDATIEVLGYPHIARLALAAGLANNVQSIEAGALAGFFARRGPLAARLSSFFGEFQIILSYLYDPDGIFEENVRKCTRAQFIAGPHRADDSAGVPATRVYLKPLERLAIFGRDAVPHLRLSGVDASPSRLELALHPGSGSESKNWPEANWADLVSRLMGETNWNILLVGGEAEGERLQRLAAALPPDRCRVAQSLPLTDLARRLTGCRAFIGHDSGISHLAAAIGLPGLVLWGHTVSAVWRPPSPKVVLVTDPAGLTGLAVDRVFQQVQALTAELAVP